MFKNALVIVAAIVAGLGLAAAGVIYLLLSVADGTREAARAVLQGAPVETRVELLEGVPDASGYALVLSDLVTGQGPRILRGPEEIDALRPQLWFSELRHEGGIFSALAENARPRTEVATLLKDGAAIRIITCPTEECGAWFSAGDRDGARSSGFQAIRDAAPSPGAAAEHLTGYYDSYAAYRAAHAAIKAGSGRWFALPGAEELLWEGDGQGEIRVTLPVELLSYAPDQASEEVERAAQEKLQKLGESWLGETEGTVSAHLTWPREIAITWEAFADRDDKPRVLPGISYRESEIVISLPRALQDAVAGRIDVTGFVPPDPLMLDDALFRAVERAGIDTACLPGCARVQFQRIRHGSHVYSRPAPAWEIESWRLIPTAPDP